MVSSINGAGIIDLSDLSAKFGCSLRQCKSRIQSLLDDQVVSGEFAVEENTSNDIFISLSDAKIEEISSFIQKCGRFTKEELESFLRRTLDLN